MSPEADDRLSAVLRICQEALAREAGVRASFLENACGGDEGLRREVEALLAEQASEDGFLEAPVWQHSPAKLVAGQRLGPYEILSAIGAGGMGEVYKARDTRLDRLVAIKVLPPDLSADRGRRARFEREAKAIAGLNHPHICTLHDLGREVPSDVHGEGGWRTAGQPLDFLVMEHIAGAPWRSGRRKVRCRWGRR